MMTDQSAAPGHLRTNFRDIDQPIVNLIERSLRNNFFDRFPSEYLTTEWGKKDLNDHLFARLDQNRNTVIPWLDETKTLRDASILEIGCGTGCFTVALAEQGAKVTAIDVDGPALVVARERCRAYGLEANFTQTNAVDAGGLFSGRHFDYIIFFAALEHMTIAERLAAMRTTWKSLSDGDLWCVIETPNRLWYYDAHTSLLPFHMWLPDELAFEYSRFSPREGYRELYREYTDEAKLQFLRRGRGVSFHEFELAMKPVKELRIKSSLNTINKGRGLRDFLQRRQSTEYEYFSLLRRIAPDIHEGFLQSYLNLIIEKD